MASEVCTELSDGVNESTPGLGIRCCILIPYYIHRDSQTVIIGRASRQTGRYGSPARCRCRCNLCVIPSITQTSLQPLPLVRHLKGKKKKAFLHGWLPNLHWKGQTVFLVPLDRREPALQVVSCHFLPEAISLYHAVVGWKSYQLGQPPAIYHAELLSSYSFIRLPTYASIAVAVSTIPSPAALYCQSYVVGLRLHVQTTFISTRANPPSPLDSKGEGSVGSYAHAEFPFFCGGAPLFSLFQLRLDGVLWASRTSLILKSSAGTAEVLRCK